MWKTKSYCIMNDGNYDVTYHRVCYSGDEMCPYWKRNWVFI